MILEFCTLTAMPNAPHRQSHNARRAPVARTAPNRWRPGRKAHGPLGDVSDSSAGLGNICHGCRFPYFEATRSVIPASPCTEDFRRRHHSGTSDQALGPRLGGKEEHRSRTTALDRSPIWLNAYFLRVLPPPTASQVPRLKSSIRLEQNHGLSTEPHPSVPGTRTNLHAPSISWTQL